MRRRRSARLLRRDEREGVAVIVGSFVSQAFFLSFDLTIPGSDADSLLMESPLELTLEGFAISDEDPHRPML